MQLPNQNNASAADRPEATATLAVAVLAGGQSRRFGTDKAQALFAGQSLLAIAVSRALAVSDHVYVVGRESIPWRELDVDVTRRQSIRGIPDVQSGTGPLGGLYSALWAINAPVLLLSCDMPAMSSGILHWLVATWRSGPLRSGVLPVVGRQVQPCAAIYPRQALQPCAQALAKGERSLQAIAQPGLMRRVTVSEDVAWRFTNCNTQQQLADLENQMIRGGEVRA